MSSATSLRPVALCGTEARSVLRSLGLRAVHAEGLLAVLAPPASGSATDRELALEHHRLVEKLARTIPLVPLRYGTAFESGAGLRRSIAARARELHDALGRLTGRVELAVRWVAEPEAGEGTSPGDWLRARARVRRLLDDRREALAALPDSLGSDVVDHRLDAETVRALADRSAGVLRLLVPRDRAEAVRRRLEARPEGTLEVLGPSAPWSFVRLGGPDPERSAAMATPRSFATTPASPSREAGFPDLSSRIAPGSDGSVPSPPVRPEREAHSGRRCPPSVTL